MIMPSGVTPAEIIIPVGERVTFMNHDTVPHAVAGGSEPAKPDCPEIDAVGMLGPGELKSTAPFLAAKTCEYHNPRVQSAAFKGRIVIR